MDYNQNNNNNNTIPSVYKDGIVLLTKLPHITSFSSLNNVKKALGTQKVGHTGTLDSFAQGLLVVCTGRFTRLAGNITEFNKTYKAIIKFGEETDTLEYTGNVIKTSILPTMEDLNTAINKFVGESLQSPPNFSAIHINGKRASDLSRQGIEIEIPKRKINVYSAELEQVLYEDGTNKVRVCLINFVVSKGTYIRSLARDIAYECNSTGHLIGLLRTQVGNFNLEDAAGKSLLKDFTIENAFLDIEDYKKISLLETDKKVKYVPSKEDEIIKKEILNSIKKFNLETSKLCGFKPLVLKDSKALDDFIHGRPLKYNFFQEDITKIITDDINICSVFFQDQFLGLVELNGKKLSYKFVIN